MTGQLPLPPGYLSDRSCGLAENPCPAPAREDTSTGPEESEVNDYGDDE